MDPVAERLEQARQRAAAQGLDVRRRKSPPYGWELVTVRGDVVESGTLTDVELAIGENGSSL